jgi:hypothetical protein
MELERATRRGHSPLKRELKRLVSAGLLRTRVSDGKRLYEPNEDGPVAREVARLVRQTRGRVPRIRHALIQLRSRTIAWVIAAGFADPDGARSAQRTLVVVTSAPKSLVRVQLSGLCPGMEIQCMSMHEWVVRLQKGDVFLRRARRARKLWILGSWDELTAREQTEMESRRLLRFAVANWREELSDEWDEEWDPFRTIPALS